MNILYAASEVAPFAKTGGLADVAGSLPKALAQQGADVRVIMPLYQCISQDWRSQMQFCMYTYVHLAWRKQYCGLFKLERDGVTWYFIDNEYYFKRDHLYGSMDDGERFGFFCRAIVSLLPQLGWKPDVVNCNDWQTALVPIFLREEQADFYRDIRTVFTIHNMEYQGRFPPETTWEVFGLRRELYEDGLLRFDDQVNLMKGAMYKADFLTTVSPSYAGELRDPNTACGLHRVVEDNYHKLRGILNGLDMGRYDPRTDGNLPCAFGPEDMGGKTVCKRELQRQLGLYEDPGVPIVACVSRLVWHKGFDLVTSAISSIMSKNVQFVVLGTGDWNFEQCFRNAQNEYGGRFSANIQYSDVLASRIYAGADIFLMPSRAEPCGLSQMIAMRYGTVPVVREVGGLKDTVRPYPAGDSNGFTFSYCSVDDMMWAISRAVDLWYDPGEWGRLMYRGMTWDFSWGRSAGEYMHIYQQLLR